MIVDDPCFSADLRCDMTQLTFELLLDSICGEFERFAVLFAHQFKYAFVSLLVIRIVCVFHPVLSQDA